MRSLWRKRFRENKKGSGPSKGAETRRKILAHAMAIAAREGLAGLTIGRLARDLSMSKSGLFAHFRSKRALEMATIHEAQGLFASQVLSPATVANEGMERLWVLCDSWLAHIEQRVFPGGYFFTGAFFECAERSGVIEDEINRMAREWWEALTGAVRKTQDRKEIDPAAEARRISLDLNGILMAAYWAFLVEKDNEVFREARIAVLTKLKGLATSRVPANALKSEKAWKRYLMARHVDENEAEPPGPSRSTEPVKTFGSIFRRRGERKAQPTAPSPSHQPISKSKSVLRQLGRATKSLSAPNR